MSMTSEARDALRKTMRSLREVLLDRLHDATESEYRLSIESVEEARLSEAARVRRGRLNDWIDEQVRAQNGATGGKGKGKKKLRTEADFRREAEKQAAYTLLNRLVILRLLEAAGPSGEPLRKPAVLTGGWESRAYRDFRQLVPALVRDDATEGYAFLLQLVFEDLATDLPGLYGPAGVADLIPIPAATLRHVVEALDAPELETCWTDDMTLGWVYQYWNDPEREALDAKLNDGGKVEPHEIASKTQMFTERYIVAWLLQNSLGPMWLAMCRQHGWTPEVEADGTLDRLEARRVDWRAKREAGEVELTDLMPLHDDAERRWAYYVPQPIPDGAVSHVPETVRDLKILDPAVGSGHFLLVAVDMLVALYREEARHRGVAGEAGWSDREIVERVLSHNLHGIDLDPRAVQIAAAALWLKAQQIAPGAQPETMNLVASNLRLASLPDDDPALVELRQQVDREIGIPADLTDAIVHALHGADHLGSLLKVDAAVEEALANYDSEAKAGKKGQGKLFGEIRDAPVEMSREEARRTLMERLEAFLTRHSSGEDLGLRLRGEQLAAGVRFVRLIREGKYDLVVANPPYQGTSKMADARYVAKTYPKGKADLFAAFLLRGLELVRKGGVSSMLTMRNWMFIKQYSKLREYLLKAHGLRALHDLGPGAFEEISGVVVSVASSVLVHGIRSGEAFATRALGSESMTQVGEVPRKRAATLSHDEIYSFDSVALKVVPEWPLVYWWNDEFLRQYEKQDKLGVTSPACEGITTGDNTRFRRMCWEPLPQSFVSKPGEIAGRWAVLVAGSAGRRWIEPINDLIKWRWSGIEVKVKNEHKYKSVSRQIRNEDLYFRIGIAFTTVGAKFGARRFRKESVFEASGRSVFPTSLDDTLCAMNTTLARTTLEALNPTVSFTVGDVNRLPLFPVVGSRNIFAQLERGFSTHESHREPSCEFKKPGPSPWRHDQDWAQAAVDRPDGAPLPDYVEELDPEPPTDHVSYAVGVALGRFGRKSEGVLDPATADLSNALPHGLLFLDSALDATDHRDSLGHPAAQPLHEAWKDHGAKITTKRSLRAWLSLDFFKDIHRGMYENRPIHWPLSSENKTFVAWVNIHRFTAQTLRVLLADHLLPTLTRLEGELSDLREARDGSDQKGVSEAEDRYAQVMKARDELRAFIADVEQCADRGPLPTDSKCPEREQDAIHDPDLDDGVMINSAALWKLLEPQWKKPKAWWKELATAKGRKDYDWSHLAMRYWPTRVDEKCQEDPSLGVAHGCFWRYHPERAWAWELRLQDEIGPDFRIEEAPYHPGGKDLGDEGDGPHRDAWLRDHPGEALQAVEKEATRRMGRGKDQQVVPEMSILESGLWSALPEEVWEMEMRLSKKQDAEFFLRAPDEAEARAAFMEANPEKATHRNRKLGATSSTMAADDSHPNGDSAA